MTDSYQPPVAEFPLLQQNPQLIYLDSAATCQVPAAVLNSYQHYFTTSHANVHRGSHRLGRTATDMLERARGIAADFIGAQPADVAFSPSTTAALNGLAQQLPVNWCAGDEILLTDAEHHANILPWQRLAMQHRLVLRFIPVDPVSGQLGEWQQLINERTRLISVTLASNITGAVFPVADLSDAARQREIPVIVDAAQAVAHTRLNVAKLDCDALVFSGHKAYGLPGCAVLYMHSRLWRRMEPFVVGGGVVSQVSRHEAELIDSIQRFEAGTPNTGAISATATALEWLQEQRQLGVSVYLQQLRQQLLSGLQQRSWLQVLPAGDVHTPVVSFYCPDIHAYDLAVWLDEHQIAVRAGHHCAQLLLQSWDLTAVVRISLAAYTTEKQVQQLLHHLDEAWQMLGPTVE
ncbi:aminotransferase class V-fold PLP-dependent enzyme [Pseudidiomarina salinarum]|uniref:aminotransferase class V-fold PLP-dependent enzyme n=1 Tax=Pseudidiomarina salinarum TaxID=435908 RepID=UPI000553F8A2|nr:aminotransferase class V-fold PLP-dependent enzyme [Pseudidiomarina salinarum]